ncbi:MAG: hypothetical protein H8D81_01825, partial [Deltaproteobacteria bacterium]|nr:hypothetical protein [Deltaproteobacteria bacterium]
KTGRRGKEGKGPKKEGKGEGKGKEGKTDRVASRGDFKRDAAKISSFRFDIPHSRDIDDETFEKYPLSPDFGVGLEFYSSKYSITENPRRTPNRAKRAIYGWILTKSAKIVQIKSRGNKRHVAGFGLSVSGEERRDHP